MSFYIIKIKLYLKNMYNYYDKKLQNQKLYLLYYYVMCAYF